MGEYIGVSVSVGMFLRLYLLSLVAATTVCGDNLRGKHLTISTVVHTPYFIVKDNNGSLTGNDRYEGILVDLLRYISRELGFTYTFKLSSDGKYGTLTNTGEWTGMIGEVVRGEADMAVADMTVTSVREMAIDFTHPYMYSGLSVLYHRQGDRRLQSLWDLPNLLIEVGTYEGGSTMNYFKNSENDVYQRIWNNMQREGAMTQSNQEGVDRVLEEKGGYAYIMEAPSIEYWIERHCDLIQVGKVFSQSQSYSLALPQGSPYVEEINRIILRLREEDVIEMLLKKWIYSGVTYSCPETTSKSNAWHAITGFISAIFE